MMQGPACISNSVLDHQFSFLKLKTGAPSFVTFHPWLPGQCVVVRWRENKSFYDILSTSQDAESRWAGRRKVLSDLRFDPTMPPTVPATIAVFFIATSSSNYFQKEKLWQTFSFPVIYLIEAILSHLEATPGVLCPQSVCTTEALRCFGCLQGVSCPPHC